MKFHIVVAVPILVASWAVLTSGSAELVVPLIPAAALHAIVANLPLVAGAAALVKGAATTGAYLYLRNRGLIGKFSSFWYNIFLNCMKTLTNINFL